MPDEKLTGHLVLATSYSRTAFRRTTIGAAAFHFRVRNGNGWCHYATITRVRNRTGGSLLSQRRNREAESLETADDSGQSPFLISKEHDFQSALASCKSKIFFDSLASTYRFSETNPLKTADATTSEF